jgi:hypothetical protein
VKESGQDVEDTVEALVEPEPAERLLRVPRRAVGVDELSAGQRRRRFGQRRIRLEHRVVDAVLEGEVVLGSMPLVFISPRRVVLVSTWASIWSG